MTRLYSWAKTHCTEDHVLIHPYMTLTGKRRIAKVITFRRFIRGVLLSAASR